MLLCLWRYLATKHKPQVSLKPTGLQVGRVFLPFSSLDSPDLAPVSHASNSVFSVTRHFAVLLESLARATQLREPTLLVGETGVGKTHSVQFLVDTTHNTLRVINMNQQSDSADLSGGFKPVSIGHFLQGLKEMFVPVFSLTFHQGENTKFLGHLDTCFRQQRWGDSLVLMKHCCKAARKKRVGELNPELGEKWDHLREKLKVGGQVLARQGQGSVFAFVEGVLTTVVRKGEWVLLDEVNMVTSEALESLISFLEIEGGSICLYVKGEYTAVPRHPNFRLFACMNPTTDCRKTELPGGLRIRLMVYCGELETKEDLLQLVTDYLAPLSLPGKQLSSLVSLYTEVRGLASGGKLSSGGGQKPVISLRSLCRALRVASANICGNVRRSLYEAFSLSLLTELDSESQVLVAALIAKHILGPKEASSIIKQPILPPHGGKKSHVHVEGFWIPKGSLEVATHTNYILNSQVKLLHFRRYSYNNKQLSDEEEPA